jgi:hypothetical protein
MAVDYDTLEVVAESGFSYVILSDEQVRGDLSQGAGPYKVNLSGGRSLGIFVRNRQLSNAFSFNMPRSSMRVHGSTARFRGLPPIRCCLLRRMGRRLATITSRAWGCFRH